MWKRPLGCPFCAVKICHLVQTASTHFVETATGKCTGLQRQTFSCTKNIRLYVKKAAARVVEMATAHFVEMTTTRVVELATAHFVEITTRVVELFTAQFVE